VRPASRTDLARHRRPAHGQDDLPGIPEILDAPDAAVTISNTRDAVDATRGPRSAVGPVWVFDPQRLVDKPPS